MIGFLGFENHMLKSSDPMAYQFIIVPFKVSKNAILVMAKKKNDYSNDILHTTDWSLSVGLQGSMRKKHATFLSSPLNIHSLPCRSLYRHD